MTERAIPAVAGQYVRRINTGTVGFIQASLRPDLRTVKVQWPGWHESKVFLTELVACNARGDQIGYLVFPEPRTASGEPENKPVVFEDGKVVSGSPEVTESVPYDGKGMRVTLIPDDEPANGYPPVPRNELHEWWMAKAAAEIDPMIAKMAEYGGGGRAIDLIEIGRAMAEGFALPDELEQPTDAWLSELGIYFYLVGKFARWKAAIQEGRKVSDDTLLDIGIYIRMAQRIRDVGGWPK